MSTTSICLIRGLLKAKGWKYERSIVAKSLAGDSLVVGGVFAFDDFLFLDASLVGFTFGFRSLSTNLRAVAQQFSIDGSSRFLVCCDSYRSTIHWF